MQVKQELYSIYDVYGQNRLLNFSNIQNYQYNNNTNKAKIICKEKAAPLLKERFSASLVNYEDQFLFLSGGFIPATFEQYTDNVQKYDIAANKWSEAPKLNIKRQEHSGCCLKNFIYVFCGRV